MNFVSLFLVPLFHYSWMNVVIFLSQQFLLFLKWKLKIIFSNSLATYFLSKNLFVCKLPRIFLISHKPLAAMMNTFCLQKVFLSDNTSIYPPFVLHGTSGALVWVQTATKTQIYKVTYWCIWIYKPKGCLCYLSQASLLLPIVRVSDLYS